MSPGFDRLWQQLLRVRLGQAALSDLDLGPLGETERALATLYREFLEPACDGVRVVAHLGMSLCGRIATENGHSTPVTCESNFVHMHRLRALADAVLVGAGTVASDDPQLTVRHVEGPSPLRVVLDSRRRLGSGYRIFNDAPPATLVLCCREIMRHGRLGRAEVLGIPGCVEDLPPAAILDALRQRGISRLFIEGGGVTVSRFLQSGCLDQLQICVAPVIIGSGREGLRLDPITSMEEAMRLSPQVIRMGSDWLFACRLDRKLLDSPGSDTSGRQVEQVLMADAK